MLNRRRILQSSAALSAGLVGLTAKGAEPIVFAINEGVTYRTSSADFRERFDAVGDELSKLLKVPVTVQSVPAYPELQKGLQEGKYGLAWVHPTHHAVRALTRNGYRLVCATKGFQDYRARFMVAGGSPFKALADLKGKTVGAPDADSITSVLTRATLRDAGVGEGITKLQYVRYQDAVPFMVENGLAAAGVSASGAVVKAWTDKGGAVLATSKPVPIKLVLAAAHVSPAQLAAARDYLLGLEAAKDGPARLAAFKVSGFAAADEAKLSELGPWLGV